MASTLCFSLFIFFLSFSISTPKFTSSTPSPLIQQACKATRFPQPCLTSLSQTQVTTPIDVIQSAMHVSSDNLRAGTALVQNILKDSASSVNRTLAAKNCLETLKNADTRAKSSDQALRDNKLKHARAWMSAALGYQYDCWSGMKYANDTTEVGKAMRFFNDVLIISTSNALSMLLNYDVFGDKIGNWIEPRTERDGFWAGVGPGLSSGLGRVPRGSGVRGRVPRGSGLGSGIGGVPRGMKVDVTVCKEGCQYKSVQEAVNAAPSNLDGKKFVIYIKEGVYDEIVRVGLDKRNLVFLGDGMGKTVITGSLNAGMKGVSTYNTATVGVLGDGFMASSLTIQNTAGPDAHQAVAFRSDSDLSVVENCEFLGNQDTLYAHSLRQFYKGCRIVGNVDFIFGNAAAVFQDCQILVRPRQQKPEKGENNAVTAQGRTDPSQVTGFVFQNCLISGTDDYMKLYAKNPKVHKNYLGRPWKEYSRTVFIHSNLEALITPQGWMPWTGDQALKTLYYGEFENSGPGANTKQRVPWSSLIPAEHVSVYTVENFIQGKDWIPSSSK